MVALRDLMEKNIRRPFCGRGHPPISIAGSSGHFYHIKDNNGDIIDTHNNKINILSPKLQNEYDLFELFKNTINAAGALGDYAEVPLANIIRSIQLNENRIFFRKDAHLIAMILANEDEKIRLSGLTAYPSDVIQSVKENLGDYKKFTTYGIIIQPGNEECLKSEHDRGAKAARYGYLIQDLALQTGGTTHSICDEDYSSIITQIGNHIEEKLKIRDIKLQHKNIIEDTINVDFNPSENAVSHIYNTKTNTIIFNTPPADHTVITISYDYYSTSE